MLVAQVLLWSQGEAHLVAQGDQEDHGLPEGINVSELLLFDKPLETPSNLQKVQVGPYFLVVPGEEKTVNQPRLH